MDRPNTPTAIVALVVSVAAVSSSAILIRLCRAEPLAIAQWRMVFAAALVVPWASWCARRAAVPAGPWRRGDRLLAVLSGLLLAAHFACWIASLRYTTVASSVVLVATQPVFVALCAPVVLRERVGGRTWLAVAATVAGVALLARADAAAAAPGEGVALARRLAGDGLAILGAATGAGYVLIGRRSRATVPFPRYLATVYAVAAIALTVSASTVHGFASYDLSSRTWFLLALLAIGPGVLGHGLMNWSVRRLAATTVTLAWLGEPVLATVYAAVWLDERPAPGFGFGAALLIGGVIVAVLAEARGRRSGVNADA